MSDTSRCEIRPGFLRGSFQYSSFVFSKMGEKKIRKRERRHFQHVLIKICHEADIHCA